MARKMRRNRIFVYRKLTAPLQTSREKKKRYDFQARSARFAKRKGEFLGGIQLSKMKISGVRGEDYEREGGPLKGVTDEGWPT